MSANRFSAKAKRDRSLLTELLLPTLFFLGIAALFVMNLGSIGDVADAEGLSAASRAVTRAAVQCYAIEGRYPASIDYLVERYGLSVDRTRYIVHYDRFAENLMPDIRVLPMTFEEDDIPAEEGWG